MARRSRTSGTLGTAENARASNQVVLLLIPVILAGVVYLNTLDHPFVYDDRVTVVENLSLRDLVDLKTIVLADVFRPLVNLGYAFDYWHSELEPRGYHLSSIALHMLNALLVFAVARRLARDAGDGEPEVRPVVFASMTATLFAVHPMMSEAVAYISGRSESQCLAPLLGAFLALRCFIRGGTRGFLALGLFMFVLALASKEVAAALPFVLLAWDWRLGPGDGAAKRRRLLRLHLPFAGAIVVAGIVRIIVFLRLETGPGLEGFWTNILVEAGVIWRYVGLLVMPLNQAVVHDVRPLKSFVDPTAMFAVLAFVVLGVVLYLLRKKSPIVVFGVLWFLLLLAPSHVIPLAEAMAEHRTYAASVGFFLALAWLLAVAAKGMPRQLRIVSFAVLVIVLAAMTWQRNRVWASAVSLWGDAAEKAPRTWAAQYEYGNALRQAGRCDDAIAPYRAAIGLLPDKLDPYANLGICLAETGRSDEAHAVFSQALAIDPTNPRSLNNLGLLMWRLGQPGEARAHFERAIASDPANAHTRFLFAGLLEDAFQDPRAALEQYREIRRMGAGTPEVKRNIERLERALRSRRTGR